MRQKSRESSIRERIVGQAFGRVEAVTQDTIEKNTSLINDLHRNAARYKYCHRTCQSLNTAKTEEPESAVVMSREQFNSTVLLVGAESIL